MALSERVKTRLLALGQTLGKTDRIVTGKNDTSVTMITNPNQAGVHGVISWTDGQKVFLRGDMIPNVGDQNSLLTILGLNWHEVAHILFSPRGDSAMAKEIQRRGHHRSYNILEDQRIEALFAARFGSASKFFTAPVMSVIIGNENSWPVAHVLVHGRRYLPKEIRDEFRKKFRGDANLSRRFENVIDRYRRLTFETQGDQVVGMRLIAEFQECMDELFPKLDNDERLSMMENQCGTQDIQHGEVDKETAKAASRRLADKDTEQEDKEAQGKDGSEFWGDEDEADEEVPDGDEDDAEEDDAPEDESEGDDGDSEPHSEDEFGDSEEDDSPDGGSSGEDQEDGGDASDEEPAGDSESDGEDDEDADDESDGGAGAGSKGDGAGSPQDGAPGDQDDESDGGAVASASASEASTVQEDTAGETGLIDEHRQMSADELREIAEAMIEHLASDAEVQAELTRVVAAMDDPQNMDVELPQSDAVDVDVTPELSNASRAAGEHLARLYSDLEAGWTYGTDSGRLNANSVMMNPDDPDEWFDTWEEGNEQDAGLEVIFLVDQSGSMSYGAYDRNGNYTGQKMRGANEALWVLMRALQEIDCTTSAIGFGDEVTKLYGREDRVSASQVRLFPSEGGDTIPYPAIIEARRILNQSTQPNKLLVILTDGVFSRYTGEPGSHRPVNIREELEKVNATRVYVGLGQSAEASYAEAFDVAVTITDAHDMARVVESIVSRILINAQQGR